METKAKEMVHMSNAAVIRKLKTLDAVIQKRAFSCLGGPSRGRDEARTQAREARGVRQKVRRSWI